MSDALSDLVSWSQNRTPEAPPASVAARMIRAGTGVTQAVLDLIDAHQPITTDDLCKHLSVGSKVIWGLMKDHLKSGRVRHDITLGWTRGFSAHERAAAAMLRKHGWTCWPPEGVEE